MSKEEPPGWIVAKRHHESLCYDSVLSTHQGALCLEVHNTLVQGFNFLEFMGVAFIGHCKLIFCDFKFNPG